VVLTTGQLWSRWQGAMLRVLSLRLYSYFKTTQLLDWEVIETVILFDLTIHLFDLTISVILFEQNFSKTLQER